MTAKYCHSCAQSPATALDVLLKSRTWEQAFAEDWRKTKSWKPGWEYNLN